MPARKRLSPETSLLVAAERLVDLATTVVSARLPIPTGRRVDTAAVRTIVAGAVAEMIATMQDHTRAVLAVGAEIGILDPSEVPE